MPWRFGLLTLSLVFGQLQAEAQTRHIRLRNETIATERPQANQARGAARTPEPSLAGLVIVQFDGPVQAGWREQLRLMQVELLHYVPDDAFVARVRGGNGAALRQLPFVRWAGPYQAAHKLHSGLLTAATQGAQQSAPVRVLLAPDVPAQDVPAVRQSLSQVDRESRFRFGTILKGTATGPQLGALAASDRVLWIEPASRMRLYDELASRIVAGDGPTHQTQMMELGFDGSGVTVAVADSGLDSGEIDNMHPDIAGRVKALFFYGTPGQLEDASDEHSHGTHCAGIIAGNGAVGETDENGFLYGLGVAPGASLIAQRIFDGAGNYAPPSSSEELTRDAVRAGADIGSNSWGDDTQGYYDLSAMEFDELVRDADSLTPGDQPYILEFSAGNAGPGYQTIGSPAVGKNVIATGAGQNNRLNLPIEDFSIYSDGPDAMADFSSRGPCVDGRIKPDVCAPGTWISSVRSIYANDDYAWWPISENYLYQGGTSQAGPHVSGAAAVFVQYYRATHAGATPSPALVKAALINSATDMDDNWGTDPVPNMDEGWGRISLPSLIGSTRSYEFVDQTSPLVTGQTYERRLVVSSSAESLKVTLAYTDVPGSPAAVKALVNDLDLEVVAPDGHVFRGNQFDYGESVPDATGKDEINNVEGVHLYAPTPGEYVVRVRAAKVLQDARQDTPDIDQDFALVISAQIPPPGTGIIAFDRSAYTVPSTIKLTLVDQDLAGQSSVSVLLRSGTETGGETITLRAVGSSSTFTATVATATGPARADGSLQIVHGDTIEAIYQDAHPAETRVFTARGDLRPPEITSVEAANQYGQVFVRWNTDEPTTDVIYYGIGNLSNAATDRYLETSHELRLTNITPNVTYTFIVVSDDEAGNRSTNDNGGAGFTFQAAQPPTVLLVDDYHDDLFEIPPLSGYTDPLNQLGVGYETWETALLGTPTLDDLRPYRCVIWRPTEFSLYSFLYPVISVQGIQALTNYLNQGGSLMISSMEFLSRLDESGYTSFGKNVLGVQSYVADATVSAIQGVTGEPIGSGISAALQYDPYDDPSKADWEMPADVSDIMTPVSASSAAFLDDGGLGYVGMRTPKAGVDRAGRVVYLSFPLDTVPFSSFGSSQRTALLNNILNFLAPPSGSQVISFDRGVYTVPASATVELEVPGLAGQGTNVVQCKSSRQTNVVSLVLRETVRRGVFRGAVALVTASVPGAGPQLVVASGDSIQADYTDPTSGGKVSVTATIETTPPVITGVSATPEYVEATVSWETSEAADALVQYSESPGSFPINFTAYDDQLDTVHELVLGGLQPDKTYYYRVISRDLAGNMAVDDNGGALYSFTTLLPTLPPWQDNMNNGPGDWYTDSAAESELNWTLGVPGSGATAHSPPDCWGSHLEGGAAGQAESFLVSPPIYLTGGNRATLHFWHNYSFYPLMSFDVFEWGELRLYTNATDYVMVQQFTDSSADWEEFTYDLTPHLGQVVYVVYYYFLLAFDYVDVPGWLVDDVSVTVDNIIPGTIRVTNNLAQAVFILSGPSGQKGTGNSLVLTNAAPGQYIIEFGGVPYYNTPPKQTNTLASSGTVVFQGDYTFTDANHNGIPDSWEVQYAGSLPGSGWEFLDSDHDGMSNYAEFVAGTNPTNAVSSLRLSATPSGQGSQAQIQWPVAAGRAYRIVSSENLAQWTPLMDWQRASSAGTLSRTVSLPASGAPCFLRVEVRP